MNYQIFKLIDFLFQAIYMALFARILLSWIPHNQFHPIIQFIHKATDPILKPFQNLIPNNQIGIDFSPILAFFALGIVKRIVFTVLNSVF